MRKLLAAALLALAVTATPAQAEGEVGRAEGEIRKVDAAQGKVTIRHGPIEGFDMPAMTMVFRTSDPALLDRIKVGERVRFVTVRQGGAMVLQSVEPAK